MSCRSRSGLAALLISGLAALAIAVRLASLRRHGLRVSAVLLIAAGGCTIYSELPLTALDLGIGIGQPTRLTRAAIAAAILGTALLAASLRAVPPSVRTASLTSSEG
jgi:hypothetical protein